MKCLVSDGVYIPPVRIDIYGFNFHISRLQHSFHEIFSTPCTNKEDIESSVLHSVSRRIEEWLESPQALSILKDHIEEQRGRIGSSLDVKEETILSKANKSGYVQLEVMAVVVLHQEQQECIFVDSYVTNAPKTCNPIEDINQDVIEGLDVQIESILSSPTHTKCSDVERPHKSWEEQKIKGVTIGIAFLPEGQRARSSRPQVKESSWVHERKQFESQNVDGCDEMVMVRPLRESWTIDSYYEAEFELLEGVVSNILVLTDRNELLVGDESSILCGYARNLLIGAAHQLGASVVACSPRFKIGDHLFHWKAIFITSKLFLLVSITLRYQNPSM